MTTKRIVFICSGNICRSPMAAALGEQRLRETGIGAVVISAGTLNIQGSPAAAHAVTAMQQIGIDISGHRSQGLSPQLMQLADHLVVMAPLHRDELVARFPELSPKIHPFWDFAVPRGRLQEIADPVGQDLAAFIACREDLEACMEGWIRHLEALGPKL